MHVVEREDNVTHGYMGELEAEYSLEQQTRHICGLTRTIDVCKPRSAIHAAVPGATQRGWNRTAALETRRGHLIAGPMAEHHSPGAARPSAWPQACEGPSDVLLDEFQTRQRVHAFAADHVRHRHSAPDASAGQEGRTNQGQQQDANDHDPPRGGAR